MARISQGDILTTPLQQPGGRFSDDGYGLITATVVWKSDQSASLGSVVNRGSTCPLAGASFCDAHKYTIAYDSLGLALITVDYVGIDPSINSGTRTNPQVGVSQGLTSEHISTHPSFFTATTGIAGAKPFGASSIATGEFKGLNGAHFSSATGGTFRGFKDPDYPLYYGRTNYLAPQTSFSGIFYTTTGATPKALVELVGKTSGDGSFNSIALLPSYMGTSFVTGTGSRNQLLLAQVNVEDFGLLYKVNYEIRYNRDGYVSPVYPAA
tara:strand:+ start:13 stop:813 length:801 start_codon:yes stop_codon:yes gene_type:complete